MNTDHLIIKINPKPDTAAGWLAKGKAVVEGATASSSLFSSIAQLLTQLASDTATLDKAQAAAANKGKNEMKVRNAAFRDLKKSLRGFGRGVQGLCDGAPDLQHAAALAAAASLDSKIVVVPHKPDFRGKALGAGAVQLYVKVPVKKGTRIFFEWQMSMDGGHTWLSLPNTNNASTRVPSLTPATIVQFRHRSTVKNVASDWSQVISVQVH
jgi:hypothetical protein